MSYTNQTQHYGLPQYIGSDVPAYLTDYNEAMAKIDQGMNAAKTQADSASTAAGQAANDITSLTATVGTQAAQISAAAQAASTAQATANTADGKADALDERVTALEQSGGLTEINIASLPGNQEITEEIPAGKTPIAAVLASDSSSLASVAILIGRYQGGRYIVFPVDSQGGTTSIVGSALKVYCV